MTGISIAAAQMIAVEIPIANETFNYKGNFQWWRIFWWWLQLLQMGCNIPGNSNGDIRLQFQWSMAGILIAEEISYGSNVKWLQQPMAQIRWHHFWWQLQAAFQMTYNGNLIANSGMSNDREIVQWWSKYQWQMQYQWWLSCCKRQ